MGLRLFVAPVALVFSLSAGAWAGELAPPAAPANTARIEARIPIPATPNPTFPIEISSGGSYYLTQDLVVMSQSGAIQITASHVTLDLNGFSIIDGVSDGAAGNAVLCFVDGAIFRNGHIRGWSDGWGFECGDNATFSDLHFENCNTGINVRHFATVRDCTFSGIFDRAIYADDSLRVEGSSVNGCGAGIRGGAGCHIVNNSVEELAANGGIDVGSSSQIRDNSVRHGPTFGIAAGPHSDIRDNSVNGFVTYGIAAAEFSNITENTVSQITGSPSSTAIAIGLPTGSGHVVGNVISSATIAVEVNGDRNVVTHNSFRNVDVLYSGASANGVFGTNLGPTAANGSAAALWNLVMSD